MKKINIKDIFKKKTENVIVEGAEAAVDGTVAEVGKKFKWKETAIGAAVVAVVGGVALALLSNKDEAELYVPDTDEPIEVTDEMIEEVTTEMDEA